MRRTAVVLAGAEPRSPRRHANGGSTGGSGIRSTSTAAISISGDHHTNDHLLSSPLAPPLSAPLRPRRLDVGGDPVAGEIAVTLCERGVDPLVLARCALQLGPCRSPRERRGRIAVPVDDTDDRQADL